MSKKSDPGKAGKSSPDPQQSSTPNTPTDREKALEKSLTEMGRTNQALLTKLGELEGRIAAHEKGTRKSTEESVARHRNEEMTELMQTVISAEDPKQATRALHKVLDLHGARIQEGVRKELEAELSPRLRKHEGNNLHATVERVLRQKGAPVEMSDPEGSFFKFLDQTVKSDSIIASKIAQGDYDAAIRYTYNRFRDEVGSEALGEKHDEDAEHDDARRLAASLENSPSATEVPPSVLDIIKDESVGDDIEEIYETLEKRGVFAEQERNR